MVHSHVLVMLLWDGSLYVAAAAVNVGHVVWEVIPDAFMHLITCYDPQEEILWFTKQMVAYSASANAINLQALDQACSVPSILPGESGCLQMRCPLQVVLPGGKVAIISHLEQHPAEGQQLASSLHRRATTLH